MCLRSNDEASFTASKSSSEPYEITRYFYGAGLARNLYVAVRPAAVDVGWTTSKMDFRSNEAGRDRSNPARPMRSGRVPKAVALYFVDATTGGRRSFVAHHEDRDANSRFYRRTETLPRRLYHRVADQPGGSRARRRRRQGECRTDRAGCRAYQGAGQGHGFRQEARRPGEIQARGASVRRLSAAEAAGARQRRPKPCGQFPLALLRPVLRGAGTGFLHVPLTDPERDREALAVRRTGRPHRKTVRTVLPRHHARQSAGARDSAEERGGVDRGYSGPRPVLARHWR